MTTSFQVLLTANNQSIPIGLNGFYDITVDKIEYDSSSGHTAMINMTSNLFPNTNGQYSGICFSVFNTNQSVNIYNLKFSNVQLSGYVNFSLRDLLHVNSYEVDNMTFCLINFTAVKARNSDGLN
jgi:hypothetical protein